MSFLVLFHIVSHFLSPTGVEYAVIRASFQQQLQHLLLTVLSLWIPLIPLLFLAQRLVDSRSGSRKAKMSGTKTPSITFADVAGESVGLLSRYHSHRCK